jgi:hypothetical protein
MKSPNINRNTNKGIRGGKRAQRMIIIRQLHPEADSNPG